MKESRIGSFHRNAQQKKSFVHRILAYPVPCLVDNNICELKSPTPTNKTDMYKNYKNFNILKQVQAFIVSSEATVHLPLCHFHTL